MRRIDASAAQVTNAAQAAADRDRGGAITAAQCRERYGLTDDEIAMLGPPRLGAPQPGSREPTQVYRVEAVLELLERLRSEREPAAVPDDVAARGAA